MKLYMLLLITLCFLHRTYTNVLFRKVIKKYIECALNPIESIDDNLNITLGGFFHHCNSDNSTIKELESFYKIKNGQLHVQINSYELLEVINSINLKNMKTV